MLGEFRSEHQFFYHNDHNVRTKYEMIKINFTDLKYITSVLYSFFIVCKKEKGGGDEVYFIETVLPNLSDRTNLKIRAMQNYQSRKPSKNVVSKIWFQRSPLQRLWIVSSFRSREIVNEKHIREYFLFLRYLLQNTDKKRSHIDLHRLVSI
ncbi:hypothetical protein Bhyg_11281 [Pseudolycoriella hygida]|uniref:Uncharacterized protein n=1 Tax=Pseudolycoriella hygida TaxID=35572 RepID=A0A9Q0MWL9_9DIPT|nr:hypothetical protein Bhyg_11281 [Pseudolycoriella hygida]